MKDTRQTRISMNPAHITRYFTLHLTLVLMCPGCIVEPQLSSSGALSDPVRDLVRDPVRDPVRDQQSCELNLQWAHSGGPLYNSMPGWGMTTNGRVIVTDMVDQAGVAEHDLDPTRSVFALRISDGEPLFQIASSDTQSFVHPQRNVSIHLESNCAGECDRPRADMSLVAKSLTDEEVWRLAVGEVTAAPIITMSPDGSKVIFGLCSSERGQAPVTRLQQLRSEDGVVEHEMMLEDVCLTDYFFDSSHHLSSPQGRHFVSGDLHSDEIIVVDFELNQQRTLPLSTEPTRRLLNLSFNHDASRLIAVTDAHRFDDSVNADMVQWSFPDLRPLERTSDVGVMLINQHSYMPLNLSPLAFSADGDAMAYIDIDGAVTIARTSDGAIMHTLEPLEFDAEGAQRWGNSGSEPTQIHFSPEGAGVTVLYTGGLAHFDCATRHEPVNLEPLTITLDVPDRVTVGQEVTFSASHMDLGELHGYAFYVDDELIYTPSTTASASWIFQESGPHIVSVHVFNGVNEGEMRLRIEVERE